MSQNNVEEKDSTNWNAWYATLIIVLVIQIVGYLIITNNYAV